MLLQVTDLTTRFYTSEGVVHAVNGISLSVDAGEIVGIAGESGCGKSVSMRSIMRIIPDPPGRIEGGSVRFKGQELTTLPEEDMRKIRGNEIAMVFQDATTALNPVLTVGVQISEVLMEHKRMSRKAALERAADLLDWVGIPAPKRRLQDYPYQYSGGQRQRVMIAMALSCEPDLLIADEPTTALDVTIQLQITKLIQRLQAQTGMAVIWITHDLGVIARIAHRAIVMYAGQIAESAPVGELFHRTAHPYTLGLLRSLPGINRATAARLPSIPGQPPDQRTLAPGCPFAPRCSYHTDRCEHENPTMEQITDDHSVACWEWSRV